MNDLLTIVIPTINRPESLNKTIRHYINEIDIGKVGDYISLMIIDSSRTNDTKKIVGNLIGKNNNIRIHYYNDSKTLNSKLKKSIDLSMLHAIQKVTSKYVWFCTDNSGLVPGSLNMVVSYLLNTNFIYVRVPSIGTIKKSAEIIKHDPRLLGFLGTFFNCNIYQVKSFKKEYKISVNKYNNTWLAFYYAHLMMLYKEKNINLISMFPYEAVVHSNYRSKDYNLNSWQENLETYARVNYFFLEIVEEIIQKNKISIADFHKYIYSLKSGFECIYKYSYLRVKQRNFIINKNILKKIEDTNIYRKHEKYLIIRIIRENGLFIYPVYLSMKIITYILNIIR